MKAYVLQKMEHNQISSIICVSHAFSNALHALYAFEDNIWIISQSNIRYQIPKHINAKPNPKCLFEDNSYRFLCFNDEYDINTYRYYRIQVFDIQ